MIWNYDASLADPVSQVRFYVGDVDPATPKLDDGEITFLLADEDNIPIRAAITALIGLIARERNQVIRFQYGTVMEDHTPQLKMYEMQLSNLKAKMGRTLVMPYAGGISLADKQDNEDDTDRNPSFFWRDQLEQPGTETTPHTTGSTADPFLGSE